MSLIFIEGFENKSSYNVFKKVGTEILGEYVIGRNGGQAFKIAVEDANDYSSYYRNSKKLNLSKFIFGFAFKVNNLFDFGIYDSGTYYNEPKGSNIGFARDVNCRYGFLYRFLFDTSSRNTQYIKLLFDYGNSILIPFDDIQIIYPNKWYYLESIVDIPNNYLKIILNGNKIIFDQYLDENEHKLFDNTTDVLKYIIISAFRRTGGNNTYDYPIYYDDIYLIDTTDGIEPTSRLKPINIIQYKPYTTTYYTSGWTRLPSNQDFHELLDEQYFTDKTDTYIVTSADGAEVEFKCTPFSSYPTSALNNEHFEVLGFRSRLVRIFDSDTEVLNNNNIYKVDETTISASPAISAQYYIDDQIDASSEDYSDIRIFVSNFIFNSISGSLSASLTWNEINNLKYGFQYLKYRSND